MNGQADGGAATGATGSGGYVWPPVETLKAWCSSCEVTFKASDERMMNDAIREHMVERHNLRPLT
jgi:hypothetical protein